MAAASLRGSAGVVHLSPAMLLSRPSLLLLALAAMAAAAATPDAPAPRHKRFVLFPKNARNGIRFNFKHNRVVPITTILAYSDGMRLTWDLPTKVSDFRFGRAIQRRDLLEMVDLVLSRQGIDGNACVMQTLCEAASIPFPAAGLISKILHRIFAVPVHETAHLGPYEVGANASCALHYGRRCPFSLFGHLLSSQVRK